MASGWIGVDLDGTLAKYDKWEGIKNIGHPIGPMVKRVKEWLVAGAEIKIFTARAGYSESIRYIEDWCKLHLGQILPITNIKDFQMVALWDDRCVQVEANSGRVLNEAFYEYLKGEENVQK